MESSSSDYKQCVSSALIQRLKTAKLLLVAETLLNQNGLQWSSPNSSDVYIIGPNKDVLQFAIECLESLLDKNRNPLCYLHDRRMGLVFKGTLARMILKSQQILKEKSMTVVVYESTYSSDVTVCCNYDDYNKIQKTIDEIRYSTSSSTDSSSLLDKTCNGYPGFPSTTPLFHFHHSKFQYSFNTKNIQVYVYRASITNVTGIDAIVNAANADLRHESGVAYAICEAAGYSMKKQCSEHFNKHGRIPIGQNCVTRPGNLKHLKIIIHAVGPCWDDYSDKKQCAMALHETIINVLRTANTHCVQKIALPPISAGIPKDLCAQMYIKAIMDYSRDVKPNNVTEIHFVDIKDDFLNAIRETHENWMKSPELLDFKNVMGYAPPHGGARARTPSYSDRPMSIVMETLERTLYSDRQGQGHHGGTSYLPCEVQYSGKKTMAFGGQQTIFKVEKNVTVRIYSGSIVKVSEVDALVCSVRSDLKGGKMAEAFELAGGAVYTKALSNLKKRPHSVGDVVLLEPGNMRSKFVLLAIMESKRIMTVDENTAQKLKDLYVKILETASAYGMKRIALTLFGSGKLVNDARNLECCCNSLFDGLTNSRVLREICVEDIQVVNFHPEVTDAIVRVFDKRSSRSQAKSKIEGSVVGESKLSSERIPKLKKHEKPIRPAQSPKIPNDYKNGGGKKEQEKYATVHVISSPRFSQDKDDSYNQVHVNGMQWKDSNEVKQKERAQYFSLSSKDEEDADNFEQSRKNRQTPVDDAKVKIRNEQLPKYTGISVTTSGEKDTEINKLEKILKDLEAKKIEMIKEKRKKELEEKIRQAEEDLRGLSAETKQEQSNKSTPPLSSLSVERDREEIELEQKLTELKEKKLLVLKERNKQELKEKIKQLEEDLTTTETVPSKDIQEEVKRCLFCSDVLRNSKKLGCGHEFCSKCFYQAFEFQDGCPVCGITVGDDDDSQEELSSDTLHSWYNSSDVIENS